MTRAELLEERASLRAEVGRLHALAYTDPLTGLPNRRALEEHLETCARDRRVVLILDLDRFKRVNDEHGHEAGDVVLRHAARRLRARLRSGDFLARLGGDEFAVVARARDVDGLAARLSGDLRTPGLPTVGVSVGSGRSVAEADRRMYDRKRASRCRSRSRSSSQAQQQA